MKWWTPAFTRCVQNTVVCDFFVCFCYEGKLFESPAQKGILHDAEMYDACKAVNVFSIS